MDKITEAYQCIHFARITLQEGYRTGQPYDENVLRSVFDKLDEAERLLTHAAPDAGRAEVTSGQVIPPAQVS